MTDIAPIGRPNSAEYSSGIRPMNNTQSDSQSTRSADRVELSEAAKIMSRLHEMPEVRTELVNRIREQIAAGTYDTPDKIEALLDELAFDLQ